MPPFIHADTDGRENLYSKVYDLATVRADFPNFDFKRSYQDFMHAPPLPVAPVKRLANVLGWHLWVHMTAKGRDAPPDCRRMKVRMRGGKEVCHQGAWKA